MPRRSGHTEAAKLVRTLHTDAAMYERSSLFSPTSSGRYWMGTVLLAGPRLPIMFAECYCCAEQSLGQNGLHGPGLAGKGRHEAQSL